MKIIDCFMYFDEDMLLDIRLNILSKFVSKFVICEANFNHNGTQKKLKFDIKNFSKFSDKIIYLPLEKQPDNLKKINESDSNFLKNTKTLDNALLRENYQRNFLQDGLKEFDENMSEHDWYRKNRIAIFIAAAFALFFALAVTQVIIEEFLVT